MAITITYSDLSVSPVRFSEQEHMYLLGDQILSGVTSMMKSVIYQDKYAGIPESVLMKAAERGSLIHSECEQSDLFPSRPSDKYHYDETRAYLQLKADKGLCMIANEYLVSNELDIATMIDCIDRDGNLYDIKTTSELDSEYLSWQLSTSAYLYELQNPRLTAGRLYGIHLRGGNAQLIEVARKDNAEVERLIEAYRRGEYWGLPELQEETPTTLSLLNLERELLMMKEITKALEEARQNYYDELSREMEQANIKKLDTKNLIISRVADSTTKTFDTTAFKKAHPELAEQFQKESKRKGYLKVTLRKNA